MTPNLDRLAEEGMVFDLDYCQGLACSPLRPSMMRSIYPRSKATAPTVGEHLQKHGMHTARVGKIFHMPVPHAQLDGSNGQDVAEDPKHAEMLKEARAKYAKRMAAAR